MAVIRLADVGDARAIAEIYAPYVTEAATSFEASPPDDAEMARRLASTLAYAPWLVCVIDGEVAGYAYASRHHERAAYRWAVDASVYLGARHHRRGIGRGLYTSLFALLRLQGFYSAYAGIALPNPASVGLHEAFGFQPVGVYTAVGFKHGRWHDVGWWQLPLRERTGEPAPPLSIAEARAVDGWDAAIACGSSLIA